MFAHEKGATSRYLKVARKKKKETLQCTFLENLLKHSDKVSVLCYFLPVIVCSYVHIFPLFGLPYFAGAAVEQRRRRKLRIEKEVTAPPLGWKKQTLKASTPSFVLWVCHFLLPSLIQKKCKCFQKIFLYSIYSN